MNSKNKIQDSNNKQIINTPKKSKIYKDSDDFIRQRAFLPLRQNQEHWKHFIVTDWILMDLQLTC